MNSTSTGFISDYSANTRFLQIYSIEYADYIIENFPFLFNNVVMNLETDPKIYKYILRKISSRNIVVFVYPAYMSLMSIKNEEKSSHIQWLSYWVLYGISCVLESMQFVSRHIPSFSLLRIIFLILCFLPNVKVILNCYFHW